MSPRRLYGPVVLGQLATGGLAWLAASRVWVRATLSTDGLPSDALAVTGTEARPVVAALALVVAAAALAVLATRGRARRAVGVLVVLVALAGIALVVTAGGAIDDAVARTAAESPAFVGGDVPPTSTSPWRWVVLLPFVLAAALGALVVRHAPAWPAMSGRYDAPAARRGHEDDDPWKALDEGRDPTV